MGKGWAAPMIDSAPWPGLLLLCFAGFWAAWVGRDAGRSGASGPGIGAWATAALLVSLGIAFRAVTGAPGLIALGVLLGASLRWPLSGSDSAEEPGDSAASKFERVFRENPESMAITSMVDQRLIEVSKGFERLTGYRREEVLGKTTIELAIWAEPAEREDWFRLVQDQDEIHGGTWSVRHRSGTVKPCLFSAAVAELDAEPVLISTVRDISDLKQTEEALRNSEKKFATAFQASPDAVMITALPDGELLEVNDSFSVLTGWSREETEGRKTVDLGLWSDLEERQKFIEVMSSQGEVRDFPCSVRHKNGEIRPFVASSLVVEIGGRPATLSVVRDVSEWRRAEAEREALVRELQAKNQELGLFSSTVSHDLKSPLITVSGFLDLLERDLASGDLDRVSRDVERIRSATRSMAQQLNELLSLSRAGRVIDQPEVVDLGELVEEVLELLLGPLAERGVFVRVEPGLPAVLGDRSRLREVVQNLIENAVKFLRDQKEPQIHVASERRDGEVILRIEDNGIGIEREHQDRIFGLFERLHPALDGSGLGLALVQKIVEVHGGRVWVDSPGKGAGSTFFVALPAAP